MGCPAARSPPDRGFNHAWDALDRAWLLVLSCSAEPKDMPIIGLVFWVAARGRGRAIPDASKP